MPTTSNLSVIIMDAHYKHSRAIARQFRKLGYRVIGTGSRVNNNRFSRYFTSYVVLPENLDDSEKLSTFKEILSSARPVLIVPIGARSVNFVSKNAEFLRSCSSIPIHDKSVIDFSFDKILATDAVAKLGIKVPSTFTPENWEKEEFHNESEYCIKNRYEFGERISTVYCDSSSQVDEFIRNSNLFLKSNLMIQSRIHGRGEGFFAIYNHGKLLTAYTHKRIRETPISGGSSTCAEITSCSDVYLAGKMILDSLNWHGAAMVEFKRETSSNELFLMEINPKFWGSLELGISAGLDFAKSILVVAGQSVDDMRTERPTKKIRFQWPFDGDLNNLKYSGHRTSIILDFLNPRVRKNVYLTDLGPTFATPLLTGLRSVLSSKLVTTMRTFLARASRQGIRVALWRNFEELTGIPLGVLVQGKQSIVLGPQLSKLGSLLLNFKGYNSSLSLQAEFDDFSQGVALKQHLRIPCTEYEVLEPNQLERGIEFISQQVDAGNRIYIHCREGVSRAAYMGIAYQMYSGFTYTEALDHFRKSRPFIKPLPNQIQSLKNYFELQ